MHDTHDTHDTQNTQNVQDKIISSVTLTPRQERRLIRPTGSQRYIDFFIQVGETPTINMVDRPPLRLALVIDRSGSMQGSKLTMAKRGVQAVLRQLSEQDSIALVAFDSSTNILQHLAPVTSELKVQVNKALEELTDGIRNRPV